MNQEGGADEARALATYAAQTQKQAAVEQAKQEGAAQAAQQQPAAAPAKDTPAELQKLAHLHKQGSLTDEEFTAMKKKLLELSSFLLLFGFQSRTRYISIPVDPRQFEAIEEDVSSADYHFISSTKPSRASMN